MLASNRVDTLKGSYYVNCAFYKDPKLDGAEGDYPNLPEYTKGNIWPREGLLKGFKETVQEMVRGFLVVPGYWRKDKYSSMVLWMSIVYVDY